MADKDEAAKYIAGLVERARKAQAQIEFATQEQVDELCTKIGFAGTVPEWVEELCEFCVEESRMGVVSDKIGKMNVKIKGVLRDIKGVKTAGLVEEFLY